MVFTPYLLEDDLKLGLDIHGVIDHNPEYFIWMALQMSVDREEGENDEIHIITGINGSEALYQQLCDLNPYWTGNVPWWTHFFSIDDHLKANHDFVLDELGRRHYDLDTWNKAKSIYCRENGIDMHIDDSPEYLEHFTTPCMLYDPDPSTPKVRYQPKYIRK